MNTQESSIKSTCYIQGQVQWVSFKTKAKDTDKITNFRDDRAPRVKLSRVSLSISHIRPDIPVSE